MIAVFRIHLVISHKEEVLPPLQHFPVVCVTIISTTTVQWTHSCVEFVLDDFLFKIVSFFFLNRLVFVQLKTYLFTCSVRVPFT